MSWKSKLALTASLLVGAGALVSGCATWNETLEADHVRKALEDDKVRGKTVIADLSELPDELVDSVGRNKYVFEDVPGYFRDVMIRLLQTETRLTISGGPAHRRLEQDYRAAMDPKAEPSTWEKSVKEYLKEENKSLQEKFDASSGPEKRILEEEIAVFEAWRKDVDPKVAKPEGVDPNVKLLRSPKPPPEGLVLRPTASLDIESGLCKMKMTLEFTDARGNGVAKGEGEGEGKWSVPGEVKDGCREAAGDAFDRALNSMMMNWK